jgi:hypothetical protein
MMEIMTPEMMTAWLKITKEESALDFPIKARYIKLSHKYVLFIVPFNHVFHVERLLQKIMLFLKNAIFN